MNIKICLVILFLRGVFQGWLDTEKIQNVKRENVKIQNVRCKNVYSR